jgi:hypothetical protein
MSYDRVHCISSETKSGAYYRIDPKFRIQYSRILGTGSRTHTALTSPLDLVGTDFKPYPGSG